MRRRRIWRNTYVLFTLFAGAALVGACGDDFDEQLDSDGGATTHHDDSATNGQADESASATGAEGGDTSDPVLDPLSDDFGDPSSLNAWTRREAVDGGDSYVQTLEITGAGLRLQPSGSGWYANYVGPMLFKLVTGDFVVETSVRASAIGDPGSPPSQLFNAGGLIVRDPDSRDGNQSWITHNIGRQQPNVGTEGKTTRDSQSHLELMDGPHQGVLRLCRIGDTFILARQLEGEPELTQTHRFDRGDLPGTLQVGMMANGWNSSGEDPDMSVAPDVEVTFEYIRFWRPESEDDCLGMPR